MSESAGGSSMMDAKQFIYLPSSVKIVVIGVAGLLLLLSALSVWQALASHAHGENVVFFLSIAQSAAVILSFFLIASFSRRDANVDQLHVYTDEFFTKYMASALSKISIPRLSLESFSVIDEGAKDIFGRLLKMENKDYVFKLWIGLNVSRIFVIYFVPKKDGIDVDDLKRIFGFTFGGAEKVGFHANYELANFDDEEFVSIWLTVETTSDLLASPQDKLFWAQDIAMMTESFLRTAHRNKIDLKLKSISPGPL